MTSGFIQQTTPGSKSGASTTVELMLNQMMLYLPTQELMLMMFAQTPFAAALAGTREEYPRKPLDTVCLPLLLIKTSRDNAGKAPAGAAGAVAAALR